MSGGDEPKESSQPHIGTLNEGSLHAQLKELVSEPGDELECRVGPFVVDIRRDDLYIEVQTTAFAAMANKLDVLLESNQVVIIHPIALSTTLCRTDKRPRRSPKRQTLYSILDELVSVPTLIDNPNLTVDVALVDVEKHQEPDPKARRGRGGWRTIDRRMTKFHGWHRFSDATDLAALLPDGLPETFGTAEVAELSDMSREAAQKLLYCLRAMDVVQLIEKQRSGYRYCLSSA